MPRIFLGEPAKALFEGSLSRFVKFEALDKAFTIFLPLDCIALTGITSSLHRTSNGHASIRSTFPF